MPSEPTETTALSEAARARPQRRPTGRLVAVHPPAAGRRPGIVSLEADEVLVGREHGPIHDKTLSRKHLAFRWDGGACAHVVEDLGSKNGASVDRVPLSGSPRVLHAGAVVRAGDVLFVYDEDDGDLGGEETLALADLLPGDAYATRRLRALVARAAADPAPVLLLGETGTGKEHVARALHQISGRAGPFLAVSCAELTGELMASQLFGHARGAYTGAGEARPGLFRSAEGGTLLLDEIGELPPSLQPKLLRVLQEREVLPVGAARPTPVDARVVAATHAPLERRVEAGGFRRDLYARLAFWTIEVPPLRARRVDLFAWIDGLNAAAARRRGVVKPELAFTPEAAAAILAAPWPENLRGVEHMVHHLATARDADDGPSVIGVDEISRFVATPAAPPVPVTRRDSPTRDELHALLGKHGSVRAVAKELDRDRRQIYRWMKAFGLTSSQ